MNGIWTWVRRASWAIGAIAAVGLFVLLVTVLAGPHLGLRYAVVKSGSMEPTLPVGSMILIRSADTDDVSVGDIITWDASSDGSHVVTHRVIEVVDAGGVTGFRTQGDANDVPDSGVVTAAELEGRVIASVPALGKLTPLLQQREFFLGIVVLCGAVLIAMELEKIYRELRPKATPEMAVAAPAPLDAMDEVRLALRWVFGPDSRSDTPPPELLRRRQHNSSQGTKS